MKFLFLTIFLSVLQPLYAQMGVSIMAEHSPMDISGFNSVVSEQLGEPVFSNASAFLKMGVGLDFRLERFTAGVFLNNISSSKHVITDTTYNFQNIRFEFNLGYQLLQKERFGLESYVGWAVNNSSYSKNYNKEYASLSQFWNAPARFKQFDYNLHSLNIGVRIHSRNFDVSRKTDMGFSLRAGMLVPLNNGNISFNDQKTGAEDMLVKQSFYVGLICSLSTKKL